MEANKEVHLIDGKCCVEHQAWTLAEGLKQQHEKEKRRKETMPTAKPLFA